MPFALLPELCNVPPGTRLPQECALRGSLRIELTYGQYISNSALPPLTEVLLDALNSGFHVVLFWSPKAESAFSQGMNFR